MVYTLINARSLYYYKCCRCSTKRKKNWHKSAKELLKQLLPMLRHDRTLSSVREIHGRAVETPFLACSMPFGEHTCPIMHHQRKVA